MLDRVLELLSELSGVREPENTLKALCRAACQRLDGMLKDQVTPEDCGEAYPLAAAWLALSWLNSGKNWEGVTALTAGDMTVRREGVSGNLERKAMELMEPYLRDTGFVFQGVRG